MGRIESIIIILFHQTNTEWYREIMVPEKRERMVLGYWERMVLGKRDRK
jgi:hypothetical protein